jgi:glycosyltransferase involved in cell wall biosynthesis
MVSRKENPFLTCIVCAFNEGAALGVSLHSLVNQSFTDFEVLIIDDGADEATRSAIAQFDDPRFTVIRQANDGLSSARNRGLRLAKGDYICFLDGDDGRPVWSFQSAAQLLLAHRPDAHFSAGALSETRGEILPFYDTGVIAKILKLADSAFISSHNPEFKSLLPLFMLLEPQAANKFVSRDLIKRLGLVFPNGLFFEDMMFHSALVAGARSFTISSDVAFTYFRRYGRPQITSTASDLRLDAISVAKMSLENFVESPRFSNVLLRGSLMVSLFRLLRWCEECTSHMHRFQFHEALIYLISAIDPRYFESLILYNKEGLPHTDIISYISRLTQERAARLEMKANL